VSVVMLLLSEAGVVMIGVVVVVNVSIAAVI